MTQNTNSMIGAGAIGASRLGAEATEDKLLGILKSEASLKEKMDACRQLGVVGTKEAVPTLAKLLGDEKLSHMARYALEPNPDASVDGALRSALGAVKGRELVGVIGSLGVRRDTKAVEPLSRLLKDSDPDVVQAAARSLGRIGTPEAARPLKETLAAAPAAVRAGVADGCMACAERLVESKGPRDEALALYESVAKAELPEHVRAAAKSAAERAR